MKYDRKGKSKNMGYKLREARVEKGLSQYEVGGILGITHAAIGSYERGRLRISVDLLCEFSKIYEKPISFFFEEDSELIKKYEEKKKAPVSVPKYSLDENLEFAMEFAIQTYLKAYGVKDKDLHVLVTDILIFINKQL